MSNEIWTKLEENFGGSSLDIYHLSKEPTSTSNHEEIQTTSTSGHGDNPISPISPTCDMTQDNAMVSDEINCDIENVIYTDNSSSIDHSGVDSLDLNTSCSKFFTHSCVKGPCIPPKIFLIKFCVDMLSFCCDHDQDASISPSCCMANRVGKIK
jgi:hypothetical protein